MPTNKKLRMIFLMLSFHDIKPAKRQPDMWIWWQIDFKKKDYKNIFIIFLVTKYTHKSWSIWQQRIYKNQSALTVNGVYILIFEHN